MTQDQTDQARGTGSVVHGQVVQDDETGASQAEQPGAVTRLKKVASALRGDKPDQTVPDETVPDETVPDPAAPDELAMTSRNPQDLSGTRPGDAGTLPGDAGAAATDPSQPGSATYGTTGPTATGGTDLATGYGDQHGTAAGHASQAGTAPDLSSSPGTTPEYGSQAGTSSGYGSEAGTASGYASPAGTATGLPGQTASEPGVTEAAITEPGTTEPRTTEPGVAEPGVAGSGVAGRRVADDAGLRPGEATDRLGDFGDIAFGNLLPDAEQYTTQWQQIQFRFVDDPQGSVTEAAEVITQVTSKLEAAIQERQRAIQERQRAIEERASALRGRWGEGSNADTETLRETLRMYRSFMDQLVGPTP